VCQLFTEDKARCLVIKSVDGVEVVGHGFTPQEINSYSHPHKMPAPTKTVLRVNGYQMGIGGDDSWGSKTHPEYSIPSHRKYHFEFEFGGRVKI